MATDPLISSQPVLVGSLSMLTIHFIAPLVVFLPSANVLSQVCFYIQIEPHLDHFQAELYLIIHICLSKIEQLSLLYKSFWTLSHKVGFFDVKVLILQLRVT